MLDRPQTRLRAGRAIRDAEKMGRQAYRIGGNLSELVRGMRPLLAAAAERGYCAERKRARRKLLRRA